MNRVYCCPWGATDRDVPDAAPQREPHHLQDDPGRKGHLAEDDFPGGMAHLAEGVIAAIGENHRPAAGRRNYDSAVDKADARLCWAVLAARTVEDVAAALAAKGTTGAEGQTDSEGHIFAVVGAAPDGVEAIAEIADQQPEATAEVFALAASGVDAMLLAP
jgi:hypothetical protein